MAFIGFSVYAALTRTVDFNYAYLSGTDVFYLESTQPSTYYKTFAVLTTTNSISVQIHRDDKTNKVQYTKLDLLVFSNGVEATYSAPGVTTRHTNVSTSSISYTNCSIIENITYQTSNYTITITNPPTSQALYVIVIARPEYYYEKVVSGTTTGYTATTPNRYVVDLFDLEMLNNEELYNFYTDPKLPMHRQPYYKNVYFLSDFVVNRELVINYPGFFNLLLANITLTSPLTIKHTAEGTFDIKTMLGKINNTAAKVTIDTPNAYYSESGSTDSSSTNFVFTNATNFEKKCAIDFSDPLNVTALDSLLIDSIAFVENIVPYQLIKDLLLPNEYQSLGVEYTYKLYDSTSSLLGSITDLDINKWRSTSTITCKLEVIASFNDTTKSKFVDVTLLGTDESSIAKGLATAYQYLSEKTGILLPEIDILTSTTTNNFISSIKQKLEAAELMRTFLNETGLTKNFTMVLSSTTPLDFEFGEEHYKRVDLNYDSTTLNYKISFSSDPTTADSTYYDLDSVDFFIAPQTLLLLAGIGEMKITIGSSDATTDFYIYGISFIEQQRYLERIVETKYLSSKDAIVNLLHIDSGRIYSGPSDIAVDYAFNLDNITYHLYYVAAADADYLTNFNNSYANRKNHFDTLVSNNQIITHPSAPPNDITYDSLFNINLTTGELTLKQDAYVNVADGYALIMKIDFIYDTNVVLPTGVEDFATYRKLTIPKKGLGGDESTQYLLGDTFASYFNSLPDGMLIDSTASTYDADGILQTTGSAFMFKPDLNSNLIGLTMYIQNQDEVIDFCTFVNPDPKHPYWWQIVIDINKIPPSNTIVYVVAEFSLYLTGTPTLLSEQLYSFIIPGIYRVGPGLDFESTHLYQYLMNVTDGANNLLYGHFQDPNSQEKFLLVDYTSKEVDTLTITRALLLDPQYTDGTPLPTDGFNIKGIELLTNTTKMIFTNIPKFVSLSPFSLITNSVITELTFTNCALTNALLDTRALYSVNSLLKLNLTNNPSVTRLSKPTINGVLVNTDNGHNETELVFEPYFYRSITTLILRTTGVSQIRDITTLPFIVDLNLEDTPVTMFYPLNSLERLKRVYLDWTITSRTDTRVFDRSLPTDDTTVSKYFYADGLVNIPEYVTLIVKKLVSIYYVPSAGAASTLMEIGENKYITNDAYDSSSILNSIYAFNIQYDTIKFPGKVFHSNLQIGTTYGTRQEVYVRYILGNLVDTGPKYLKSRAFNHYGTATSGDPHSTSDLNQLDDSIKPSVDVWDNRLVFIIAETTYKGCRTFKVFPVTFRSAA
jgi:hypothetical protein